MKKKMCARSERSIEERKKGFLWIDKDKSIACEERKEKKLNNEGILLHIYISAGERRMKILKRKYPKINSSNSANSTFSTKYILKRLRCQSINLGFS